MSLVETECWLSLLKAADDYHMSLNWHTEWDHFHVIAEAIEAIDAIILTDYRA